MADADGNIFGPFDVSVPDSEAEPFTEEAYFRIHDESGVVEGGELTFTGLTAQLAPLFAYSHGAWLLREETWEDEGPATTGADPRRDLLVIRRTLTVGEGDEAVPGRAVPVVLRGTPAAAPVNPDHDPETDERLWSWRVPGSGGTVVTVITDHRRYVNRDGSPIGAQEAQVMVLHGSGTQSIGPGVYRKVTMGSAEIAGGPFTFISGEIRCDLAGVIEVSGKVTYAPGTVVNQRHLAAVALNGSYLGRTEGRADPAVSNTVSIPTATYPLEVAVGDRIALHTRVDGSAAQDVDRVASFLSARYLGPAPA